MIHKIDAVSEGRIKFINKMIQILKTIKTKLNSYFSPMFKQNHFL